MFGMGGCGSGPGFGRFMGRHGRGQAEGGGRGGRFWASALQGLDLNDLQVEQIAELKGKSFSKFGHGKIDMFELHKELFKELSQSSIDRKKVSALSQKIKEQKSQMTDLMIENMLAFAEILTPEQRKKMRTNRIRQFLGTDEQVHDEE
jgi:Spy/CpxP family protein refolding chaperone